MSVIFGALSRAAILCVALGGQALAQQALAQRMPLPPPPRALPEGAAPGSRAVVPRPPPVAAPSRAEQSEPEARIGRVTSLPIPRFVALKTDDVNLRVGPGRRYPVEWVYKRRGLPVEIEREFDVWRLIRDPDGVKGWVHQATLTGRRNFFVKGRERDMRAEPSENARVVARLQVGVVGQLRRCEANAAWCQVRVGDHWGWLKRSDFWGTLPGEAVN